MQENKQLWWCSLEAVEAVMASTSQSPSNASENTAAAPPQSRRKISLPWFRQSSFGLGGLHQRLPKQHTIATSNLDPTTSPQVTT